MTHPFATVLFDLDGTLVDSATLVAESACLTFAEFKLPVPAHDDVIAYMGIPIEVYFEKLGGPDFTALDREAVFARYRTHFKDMLAQGRLKPFEGIPDLLAGLKARGITTGIATSKTTQPAIYSCECAGIAAWLDVYVGSDMVTAYKPAPDTVLKCLELLGRPAGRDVCVVGDAEGDIGMGRDAGATTCGVTWGAHDAARLARQSPGRVVDTVTGLASFLGL